MTNNPTKSFYSRCSELVQGATPVQLVLENLKEYCIRAATRGEGFVLFEIPNDYPNVVRATALQLLKHELPVQDETTKFIKFRLF